MSEPRRPYISFGQTDRPPAEEHHDGVELLVRDVLAKYAGDLLQHLEKHNRTVLPLAAEQVMEKAYFTSTFGELRLMGTAEVAEFLGVHKRRVQELRRAKSLKFPAPVAELRMGPVWLAADIEKWAPTWERKTGRPRKEDG